MQITPQAIPDVLLIEPDVYPDTRGEFLELFRQTRYAESGIDRAMTQVNLSRSRPDVLRGLHYQLGKPQAKLIQALSGRIFDIAVDLRRSSPTFGRHVGIELEAESRKQLFIPEGFAHGFCVLDGPADVLYGCSDEYAPAEERTLLWNDPALKIRWPLTSVIVSEKDRQGVPLTSADLFD